MRDHNTQQTSIDAYYSIDDLGSRQKFVLELIRHYGNMTNREIASRLGWEINRVTPRVNELVKLGFVTDQGTKLDPQTGKRAIVWGEAERTRQITFI
jgi:DNA-binding MarR family transcriptional regulator